MPGSRPGWAARGASRPPLRLASTTCPRVGQGPLGLPLPRGVAVVPPCGLDRLTRADGVVSEVSLEARFGLLRIALQDVELVELPFAVVALLGGEEEGPLLPVGKYGHRHALVEGVLEELAVGPLALADLLDLD